MRLLSSADGQDVKKSLNVLRLSIRPAHTNSTTPIQIAAQSNEWVCDHSLGGIAGSNPAGGMVVSRL